MHKHITRFSLTLSNVFSFSVKSPYTNNSNSLFYTNDKSGHHVGRSRTYTSNSFSETTKDKLFSKMASKNKMANNKITVVGPSALAAAAAFTLLAQNVTNEICMIDINDDRLRGEKMDLQFGSMYLQNAKIIASKDHADSADSKICVIAAGTPQGKHEIYSDYVTRNAGIVQAVVPSIMKHSPNAILIVASEPVDVLTHVAWKSSGLAMNRVMGTGTSLDSDRFRYMVAERLGVAPGSCYGYIIGQRGKTSVPVWSSVNVAGIRLTEINPHICTVTDLEDWESIHKEVVKSDEALHKLKGYESWGMALIIANLCHSILSNAHSVHVVSTYAKGEHGILDEVFVSLPCVLGRAGVTEILRQQLTETEHALLRKSAESVAKVQESVKILDQCVRH